MAKKTAAAARLDDRISRLFSQRCNRIAVDISDLSNIYAVGLKAIADGLDDAGVGDALFAYVQTIRKN